MDSPLKIQFWIALIFTALISVGFSMLEFSLGVSYLIAVNLVTLAYYGWDKWRAIKQRSRTAEWCLHLLALLGGILGAFVGQQWFRHKTQKRSFRIIFWIIVVLHITGWSLWWHFRNSFE